MLKFEELKKVSIDVGLVITCTQELWIMADNSPQKSIDNRYNL